MKLLLLTSSGQIGRKQWWLGMLIAIICASNLIILNDIPFYFNLLDWYWPSWLNLDFRKYSILIILFLILLALGLFMATNVTLKRLTDRKRSKWWVLPLLTYPIFIFLPLHILGILTRFFIPIYQQEGHPQKAITIAANISIILFVLYSLITLWLFIELGFRAHPSKQENIKK